MKQFFDNFMVALITFWIFFSAVMIVFKPDLTFLEDKQMPSDAISSTNVKAPEQDRITQDLVKPESDGLDSLLILDTLQYITENSIRLAEFQGVTIESSAKGTKTYYGYFPESDNLNLAGIAIAWTVNQKTGDIILGEEINFNDLPITQIMINRTSFLNNIEGISDLTLNSGNISFRYLELDYSFFFDGGYLIGLEIVKGEEILKELTYSYKSPREVREYIIIELAKD